MHTNWSPTGSLLDVDFVFDTCNGSTLIPHDVGAVAVIDGSKFEQCQSCQTISC